MDPKSTNFNSHVLPTELWAWIFEIGAHIPTRPTASPTEHPFPLLVSRVSRHWRDVAINSPGVWTNVHWDISKPFPDIWFERSKSNLLDITLYCDFQPLAVITDRLIPHMNRCFQLIIEASDVDIYDLLKVIEPLKDVSAPRLEHVEMRVDDDWPGADGWTQPHFLTGGTPNLSFMQLDAVYLQHAPPLVCVLSLDLHNWLPNRIDLHLLSTASSLTKLVLHECIMSDDDDEEIIVVEIPSLLSLGIVPPEPSSSLYEEGSILKYLSLPNLEYLEIVQATLQGLIDHFPIQHETPRYPKLQTLRLDSLELADYDDIEEFFLLAFPTISHLQLINTRGERILPTKRIPSQMFHDAASSSSMASISKWPNLHTITLKTDLGDDLNWLNSMLLARNAMEKPLQRIRLSDPPYFIASQIYAFGRMRLESLIKVDVVGDDEIRGIVRQEAGSVESRHDLHQPTASTSSSTEISPTDFIHGVASSLDEFDTVFKPDGDINFERDFGQWVSPDESDTSLF